MALRVVLGQQVSTRAAATTTARLVRALGEPLPDTLVRPGGPTHLFPAAGTLAALADGDERLPGMPAARRRTLLHLARALAAGEVDLGPGASWAGARTRLAALPGVGPWTTEIIAMRALRDPDAFPASDLGVLRSAARAGLPPRPAELELRARVWRPWRSYATQLLWASGDHEVARLPGPLTTGPTDPTHPDPDSLTEAS
jgi:AraC family transcriptional regulator of adaptative response / DNA-3-methyladenine glycosylase II